MQLAEAKRSTFSSEAERLGYETERVVDAWLASRRPKIEYWWHNRTSKSFKVDFTIGNNYLEVERKDEKYLGLAIKYGFDFLAPKVHQYIEWDSTVFYMLVPSHHKSCVYATVVEIMLHGEPIRKKTTRGGWEWFYRVPTSKLRVIDFER